LYRFTENTLFFDATYEKLVLPSIKRNFMFYPHPALKDLAVFARSKSAVRSLALATLIGTLSACGGGGSDAPVQNPVGQQPGSNPIGAIPPNAVEPKYLLGGVVTGLDVGETVSLTNGKETVILSSNSQFTFKDPIEGGSPVSIAKQPGASKNCAIIDVNSPSARAPDFRYAAQNAGAVQVSCTVYPAFKAPLPIIEPVLANGATPTLIVNAKVVPVFFLDTPDQDKRVEFLNKLLSSELWKVLSEYGIGAASLEPTVVIPTNAPTQASVAYLEALVKKNAAAWARDTSDGYFYMIYLPAQAVNDKSACGGGYHTSTTSNQDPTKTKKIAYAVMTGCDNVDRIAQHEVMEGVADPFNTGGYYQIGKDDHLWRSISGNYSGSEIGDMCETRSYLGTGNLTGYSLQPIGSNLAAAAGKNPCGPTDNNVFFGAVPQNPDRIKIDSIEPNQGIVIASGQTKTVQLRVFSNTYLDGPISLRVVDKGATGFSKPFPEPLILKLNKDFARNGDVIELTITTSNIAYRGLQFYEIVATHGSYSFSWPGAVGNTAN
jgi:hypothetical protein